MTKLIVSDLDGTLLLNGAQKLNPEMFDLIRKLKECGISFMAASGRQLASQRNLFRPVADEISYIGENGAICVHNGELFTTCEIPRDLAFRIIHCVQQRPECRLMISCIDTIYIKDDVPEFLHHLRDEVKVHVDTVASFDEIKGQIFKIAYMGGRNYLETMQYFQSIFSSEIQVVTSGNSWVDFVPLNSNKGTALKIMLDKMGISPADVIAFGDQQNDMEMLRVAGKSYAMSHSSPEVKACADEVTDSVEKTLREIIKTLEE